MIFLAVLLALTASSAGFGAVRVEQIIRVPAQRAQTVKSLTVDSDGNLIVTGSNVQGGFLTKMDSSGKAIFTFANFGANPAGAAVDGKGDIYWIGTGGAPGFPFPSTKTVLPVARLGSAVPGFVVKFRGNDGFMLWAAKIEAMQPQAIVLDAKGLVTLAGPATAALDFATPGAYHSPAGGNVAPLSIVRLTQEGDVLFAATYGGHSVSGPDNCVPNPFFGCVSSPKMTASSVLLDARGNIWIAGSTNVVDLPVSPNALKSRCGCSTSSGDGYLAEFSTDGSTLLYATYVGTSTHSQSDSFGDDTISSAAMDASGHIWLAGTTNGADLPVTGNAAQPGFLGESDGFLLQYDPAANKIGYGTYYGTQGVNTVTNLAIGADGSPILSGHWNYNRANPYSFGTDFVAVQKQSGIDKTLFLRSSADAGLVVSRSGAIVVAGRASVISMATESSSISPSVSGVANSASLDAGAQVSPGELISIFGMNLGPVSPVAASSTSGLPVLPTQLENVRVLFDGVAAPLLYVSNTQINLVVPFGVVRKAEVKMIVETSGVNSSAALLGVVPAVPAIFTTQAAYQNLPVAFALNQDGTVNSQINRAAPGSVIAVFATGFGALTPQPQDGSFSSKALPTLREDVNVFSPGFTELMYAGPAPGQVAGAMQVNFRVPENTTATPTITLFVAGWPSAYFTVWVTGT